MKVAFFSEIQFNGKYAQTFSNSRTDVAWQQALNAEHFYIHEIDRIRSHEFDIVIIILPKKAHSLDAIDQNIFDVLHSSGAHVGIMQEGPNWYFQDYDFETNLKYYTLLLQADFILCHNEIDVPYFKGLAGHDKVYIMPSTMKDPSIHSFMEIERKDKAMIGGGFTSWYSGFDSYVVTQRANVEAVMPSMGRRQDGEEKWGIEHLPYMDWLHWIMELNYYKYGVHMMRTFAAGTFAMNCAALGIPCIGYKDLDTQRNLHPALSVDVGDLGKASELLTRLKNDEGFYKENSELAKINFKHSKYEEFNYRNYMLRIFEKVRGE